MTSVDAFISAGGEAAAAFALEVEDLQLLSHSENIVLAVLDVNGRKWAMRFHRPGYNTVAELQSEVRFLESLREFGVAVPHARPADNGPHYVPIDVDGVVHQVGVIGWVAGEPIGGPLAAAGPEMVDHYRGIGELAARIRQHAEQWHAPQGFVRRRWDAAGLLGESPLWGRFWEVDLLSREQQALFSEARDRLRAVLEGVPLDLDHFGLIHADLHLGNVMADGDALTVIDFDDSGYGYYMHELAVALYPMVGDDLFGPALDALLEGYRRVVPLADADVELIDHFLVVRSLMIIGWLADRPEVPYYEQFDEIAADIEAHVRGYLGSA